MPLIAVVGGGISGLACAHRLLELKGDYRRLDLDVVLLEKEKRLGGIIGTEKKNGFLLEKGPDAFLSEKPAALMLCKTLGIDKALIGTEENNRGSFVVRNNRLVAVPEGFYLTAPAKLLPFLASPLLSLPGRVRAAMEFFMPAAKIEGDESVGSFIRRRFGKEMLERVGQAMLAGIYTGDPDNLSLRSTLSRFAELEAKHGSVIRGLREEAKGKDRALWQVRGPRYSLFLSFREGMHTLTNALNHAIPASSIRLGFSVRKISFHPLKKEWMLVSEEGESVTAAAVCIASPPRAAAKLVSGENQELSAALEEIQSESVATAHFAFEKKHVPKPLRGFGFVVPAIERKALVACSYASQKFSGRAPEGYVLLRAFVGGAFGKDFYALPDAELLEAARADLERLLGIKAAPYFSDLNRHPGSMIQYRVGHSDLVKKIRDICGKSEGLFVTGAAYRGVGLPDCIEDGRTQAETIFKKVFS